MPSAMSEKTSNLSSQTMVMASQEQISCDLGEEAAILGMRSGVYYGLNPIGARVWNLLQQPRSVGEIRDAIVGEYDVTAEYFEPDLIKLLQQMLREGLVELTGTRPDPSSQSQATR